ncbi:hypothetical protein M569_14611 [Genlisea aurea]|uniref:Uncharacterized protein n=1 Tax=Genlisea aurea TaxID=192259 RepID=S8C013_9LAMI|nr:hypothetical protein M569_14611 [Genlisea aurea]
MGRRLPSEYLIYAGFRDGAFGIFDADTLSLRVRIAPSAYISSSSYTFPASRPWWRPIRCYSYQFALGMSDGAVQVMEPLYTDTECLSYQIPEENGVGNNSVAVCHRKLNQSQVTFIHLSLHLSMPFLSLPE